MITAMEIRLIEKVEGIDDNERNSMLRILARDRSDALDVWHLRSRPASCYSLPSLGTCLILFLAMKKEEGGI